MKIVSNSLLLLLSSLCISLSLLSSEVLAERALPKLGYKMTAIAKPIVAPSYVLDDFDDVKFDSRQLKGKVVMLNFWATWCPPCRREMPSMERLYQKFKNKNFAVIAINQMEDSDTVFVFSGQLALEPSFTFLFDKTSEVSRRYKVKGLPTTYLIDKQGMIRYRAIGGREFDHPEIEKIINGLLNE